MELFFKESADEFRRLHLTESLFLFRMALRWTTTPDLRKSQRYLKNVMPCGVSAKTLHALARHGDLDFVGEGRRWQLQRHIYLMLLYYIDYTLAQTCAPQFCESRIGPR